MLPIKKWISENDAAYQKVEVKGGVLPNLKGLMEKT
jgi:hypothetical protein